MFGALFKNVDLYKGIVLASVLVLPAGGGVLYWLKGRVEEARIAVDGAMRPNGPLENIGQLYKQLETLESSRGRGGAIANTDPSRYFDQQLKASVRGLSSNDFTLTVREDKKGAQNATDTVVALEFRRGGKDKIPLSQEVINAVLYNCEAQSQGVWKVRKLQVRNVEAQEFERPPKTPPITVKDEWYVEKLEFARRQPDTESGGQDGGRVRVRGG